MKDVIKHIFKHHDAKAGASTPARKDGRRGKRVAGTILLAFLAFLLCLTPAKATNWGGWVATDDWRTGLDWYYVGETNTTITYRIVCRYNSIYGWTTRTCVAEVGLDGQTASGTFTLNSHQGDVQVLSHDFTISKGDGQRTVSCYAKTSCPSNSWASYRNGSTAYGSFSIPAAKRWININICMPDGSEATNGAAGTFQYSVNGGGSWSGNVSDQGGDCYAVKGTDFRIRNIMPADGLVLDRVDGASSIGGGAYRMYVPGNDSTIYIRTKWASYPITYNLNGGSVSGNPTSYTKNSNNFTLKNPTRTGYTFAGWSGTGLSGNANKSVTIKKGSTGGRTYTANWTKNSYYLDLNGLLDGTASDFLGSMGTADVYIDGKQVANDVSDFYRQEPYGSSYEIKDIKVKPGYSYQGVSSGSIKGTIGAGDAAVQLKFASNTVKVTFDGNGGEIAKNGTQEFTSGKGQSFADTGAARAGWSFLGWADSKDADQPDYAADQAVTDAWIGDGGTRTVYAVWKAEFYTVSFDANGGRGSMDSQTIQIGEEAKLPGNAFERDGYEFAGWNTAYDGTGTSYEDGATVKDIASPDGVTLFAQWKKLTYKISYDLAGGEADGNPASYQIDTADITLKNPTRTGYVFAGWSGTGLSGNANKSVTIKRGSTGDKAFKANWYPIGYRIHFEPNGGLGTMSDIDCSYDEPVKIPTWVFVRDHYRIRSWNTEADGSGQDFVDGEGIKNLTTKQDETVTLYAQWERAYDVTWVDDYHGLDVVLSHTDVFEGDSPVAPQTPSHEGYAFLGWNTAKDGSGTDVNDAKISGDTTFYARFGTSSYAISFDANGGTGSMDPVTMTFDKNEVLPDSTFEKPGYHWVGWNTKADGSGTWIRKGEKAPNLASEDGAEVTLYAQWEANGYTIKFHPGIDDGQDHGVMADLHAAYDDANLAGRTLPQNRFHRTCYRFTHWSTTAIAGATGYREIADMAPLTKLNLTQDQNIDTWLYAQWEPVTYTVHFDANGGDGLMNDAVETIEDQEELPDSAFSRTGYDFIGWNTKADGSGTAYAAGDALHLADWDQNPDITLYAQWSSHAYTVSFVSNGGSEAKEMKVPYGREIGTLPGSTKSGYSLDGWYDADEGGSRYDGSEIMPEHDLTLYARWSFAATNLPTTIVNGNMQYGSGKFGAKSLGGYNATGGYVDTANGEWLNINKWQYSDHIDVQLSKGPLAGTYVTLYRGSNGLFTSMTGTAEVVGYNRGDGSFNLQGTNQSGNAVGGVVRATAESRSDLAPAVGSKLRFTGTMRPDGSYSCSIAGGQGSVTQDFQYTVLYGSDASVSQSGDGYTLNAGGRSFHTDSNGNIQTTIYATGAYPGTGEWEGGHFNVYIDGFGAITYGDGGPSGHCWQTHMGYANHNAYGAPSSTARNSVTLSRDGGSYHFSAGFTITGGTGPLAWPDPHWDGVRYQDVWCGASADWTLFHRTGQKTAALDFSMAGDYTMWQPIDGWSQPAFGWKSTSSDHTASDAIWRGSVVQYYPGSHATVTSYKDGYLYQDVRTNPGGVYHWTVKHASAFNESDPAYDDWTNPKDHDSGYLDKMNVLLYATPADGKSISSNDAQYARRTYTNGLSILGKNQAPASGDTNQKDFVSRTIESPAVTGTQKWDAYEGFYVVPNGQSATRMAFRHADGSKSDPKIANALTDVTLEQWFALRYDLNGGTGSVPTPWADSEQVKVYNYFAPGSTAKLVTAQAGDKDASGWTEGDSWDESMVSRTDGGHNVRFIGWTTDRQDMSVGRSGYKSLKDACMPQITTSNHDNTVYAAWAQQPTVRFHANADGDVSDPAPQMLDGVYTADGEHEVRASDPWSEGDRTIRGTQSWPVGWAFDGWYTADGQKFDFSQPVYEDVDLYAHWGKLTRLTFNYAAKSVISHDTNEFTDADGNQIWVRLPYWNADPKYVAIVEAGTTINLPTMNAAHGKYQLPAGGGSMMSYRVEYVPTGWSLDGDWASEPFGDIERGERWTVPGNDDVGEVTNLYVRYDASSVEGANGASE